MPGRRVCVKAHASSANLGPGFDALSVALTAFHDVVCVGVEEPGSGIVVERVWGPYADGVDFPGSAVRALEKLMGEIGVRGVGLAVEVYKGIPVSRGLGSSGASAAAAVVALNHLLSLNAGSELLVEAAGYGETASAGTPHYDNVAASILGGLAVVAYTADGALRVASLPVRAFFALAVPQVDPVKGKTGVMRSVLPRTISLATAVSQWQRAAMLVAALAANNLRLAGEMMSSDTIVEPARAPHIPCYERVRRAALEAGAYGVAVSGAGPTMIALAGSEPSAASIAREMARAFSECGIGAEPVVSGVAGPATVVEGPGG